MFVNQKQYYVKKNNNKTRDRFSMMKISLDEEEINPQTSNIETGIVFDLINDEHYLVNINTGKKIKGDAVQHGYQGLNKLRITSEIPLSDTDFGYSFKTKLDNYKHLVAIDTNSAKHRFITNNFEVSVGLGIAVCYLENGDSWKVEPIKIPFIARFNSSKPENENWINVIELIKNKCGCPDERKVGIIVDSDLGNIPDYNNRKKPILGDYYLPENFELIFASDKVSDNLFNKMIKLSHKLSKEFLPQYLIRLKESEQEVLKRYDSKDSTNESEN